MSFFFRRSIMKGDKPGHPFRGNQYTTAAGGGQSHDERGVARNAPGGEEYDPSHDAAGSLDGVYAANVGASITPSSPSAAARDASTAADAADKEVPYSERAPGWYDKARAAHSAHLTAAELHDKAGNKDKAEHHRARAKNLNAQMDYDSNWN